MIKVNAKIGKRKIHEAEEEMTQHNSQYKKNKHKKDTEQMKKIEKQM